MAQTVKPNSTITHTDEKLILQASVIYFTLFGIVYSAVCMRQVIGSLEFAARISQSLQSKIAASLFEVALATLYVLLEAHMRKGFIAGLDKEDVERNLNINATLYNTCKKISAYYLVMHIVFITLSTLLMLMPFIGVYTSTQYMLMEILLYAQLIVSITAVVYTVTLRKNVIQIKQTNTYIIRGE